MAAAKRRKMESIEYSRLFYDWALELISELEDETAKAKGEAKDEEEYSECMWRTAVLGEMKHLFETIVSNGSSVETRVIVA